MKRTLAAAIAGLATLIVLMNSVFVIDQAEQGIIVQFGEPIGSIITEPGLHWRVPFVQDVRRFDKRLLTWDGDVSQIPTLGREFVIVDTSARWRIKEPLQFLRSVRDERGARSRLDDILDSVTRDIISGTDLEEIVRSADWKVNAAALPADAGVPVNDVALERPKKGRAVLEKEMMTSATRLMPALGIELIDVRIKRINYIDSVRAQVENRMIAERQSIAARFRAEGQGRSQEILGETERQLRTIRSEAARTAQGTIGIADAEATRIYGQAYGADAEFYSFFRTLESYKSLGENTTLMIDAQSDFFRYLQSTRRR